MSATLLSMEKEVLEEGREQWGLAKWARMSPELEQRLAYNAAVTGSYEKAAQHAKRWCTVVSDDAIHAIVGRVAERNESASLPPPPPPKAQEQPFSLVIMLDGWMVRQRGAHWGVKPGPPALERVSWKEVKSAILYRLEDRAANASGRGMLIEKKLSRFLPIPISLLSGPGSKPRRCAWAWLGSKKFSSWPMGPSGFGT